MLRPVYGPVSSQAKSLVAAQPVETLQSAGAGAVGRGGPFGLPRVNLSRRCGLPRPRKYSNSQSRAVAGDEDFHKARGAAPRRRRRHGDVSGVVLGHFSRRLTSHFRAGICPRNSIKLFICGFWHLPASTLQPRTTARIGSTTETVYARNAIAIAARRAERQQNRLAGFVNRPTRVEAAAERDATQQSLAHAASGGLARAKR